MQSPDGQANSDANARCARFVQRNFLWLLLGSCALATLWPGAGLAMRSWEWSPIAAAVPISLPLLLLALLFFCAALLTELGQIRSTLQHPIVLLVAVLAVWLGPALLVAAAGWILPWSLDGQETTGLLVGLAVVAAMPVANSSVGWVQNAGGNLALGLALVVLSISLSPWVTPHLLELFGMSLSASERAYCLELVTRFSGWFFIIWVILPTAAGFLCRQLLTPNRVAAVGGWIALASAVALLVLNYVNSAVALPKIFHQSKPAVLIATLLLAAALSVVGLLIAWAMARIMRLPDDTRSALLFGLSMKHTGLALVLAGKVLADQPLAILIIVLATLMQHLLAGVVQWRLMHHKTASDIALP